MSYARVKYGTKNGQYNYSEFVCDAVSDIANLPTRNVRTDIYDICSVGSKAFVVADSSSYMLSPSNVWTKVSVAVSGGGSGSSTGGSDDSVLQNVDVFILDFVNDDVHMTHGAIDDTKRIAST